MYAIIVDFKDTPYPIVMDVMKMIEAFTTCLANFNSRLKVKIHIPNSIGISPQTHMTCG